MEIDISIGCIDDVLSVDKEIPEFASHSSKKKMEERLANKKHLILIARVNGYPVAYKIGYEEAPQEFYSWLGGVIPQYRKQGIATKLRNHQESWAKDNGYHSIGVKSMNRYAAMLQLLISSGYKIIGYEDNGDADNSKIRFKKWLV